MLFIHAVNPFGFAHMLRVNENNVDLNRNFVDFESQPPANPVYAAIADSLPQRTGLDEALVAEWNAAVARAAEAHGDWAVGNALGCGQYGDPGGVEYGALGCNGLRGPWSRSSPGCSAAPATSPI